MRIVNTTRGSMLGSRVALADNWWSRLRGFLLRPRPRAGEGLLLTRCNAIHMWGMRFPLDVVFLDATGEVLEVIENLAPGSTPKRVPGGRYVLELPVGTIAASGTSVGDICTWTPTSAAPLRLQEI